MGAHRRHLRTLDALAVTVVAWVRVGVAIAAAAAGAVPHDLSHRANVLFVVLGLVWVPWAIAVLFASERPGNAWALVGGPVGDIAALFAVEALAPGSNVATLSGYLVVIAFTAYTVGRATAGVLAAAAISLAVLAQALLPAHDRLGAGVLGSFALAAVAIVFLLDRTSALQGRASARAARLESQAEAVLARIADGVVVTDADSYVSTCNPAAERIVGRAARDVVGSPCHAVLGLHRDERLLDCTTGCALLREIAHEDDLGVEVWRDLGDRRQPLLANATAVHDHDGIVVEVVHSLRDVTRLKQAEEAKTLFLATASHELKTPLTVIRGFVEMLRDDIPDDARELAVEAVHRRAVELGEIVDRLLLSSRIEAGRIELAVGEVDVAEIVEERVLALASAAGREVVLIIDPDTPPVAGDASALATVLDHLLDNAVKYSPDGGPITVSVEGSERVQLTVADCGIGMDTEQLAHCFDKFWQAESSDVRRFGGTGIGLYIVRSLVEGMGGTITARSEPGVGTTFTVELCCHDGPGDEHPPRGESTMIREFMRQIGVPGSVS